MEIFWVTLCFETREHSVKSAADNSKAISQALQITLLLYISKLYYISIEVLSVTKSTIT